VKALALLAIAALAACYDPGAPCGDGYCDDGTVCTPAGDRCVYPQQLVDCVARPDGEACIVPGGREGICAARVCRQVVCGDGVVEGSEQCDGTNYDGATDCSALGAGYHPAGTLSCSSQCRFDPSTCTGRCGDGVVQPGVEACDRSVGALTCVTQGYRGGTLTCGADCQLDVRACEGRCGDGVRTGDEQCDGTDFGDNTCGTFGFYEGTLRCSAACQVETASCVGRCGDDIKNGPEICDGPDLGGLSCPTYGWYGGALACGEDCVSINPAACSEYCGDGVKNGNELCDGLDHDGASCTTLGALAGALGCNAFCQPTTDACYWGGFRPVTDRVAEASAYRAVWARSPRDIWASTLADHLLHFDGVRWHAVDVDLEKPVRTFWWSPVGYLWALSDGGELAYHDGHTWTVAHRGLGDVTIDATSPSNVWVADVGVVRHFDGTAWSDIAWPTDAWPDRVFAAPDGTAWFVTFDRLLHLDGAAWTEHDLDGAPFCLWGTGSDVYTNVFGWDGVDVLYRHDGTQWAQVDVPGLDGVRCGWSDSDGSMWIAGTADDRDVVVRLDAEASWLIPADDIYLERPWAHDGHLWTYDGERILRVDGPPWQDHSSPAIDDVEIIFATSTGTAWVGSDSGLHRVASGEPLSSFATDSAVFAIWAGDTSVRIGGAFGMLRHSEDGFEREAIAGEVTALWGAAEDDIWSISFDGAMHHYDGAAWTLTDRLPAPRTTDAQLTGTDASNLWARYGTQTYRREGDAWVEVDLTDSRGFYPIATTGPTDHWTFGAGGVSYQHDGEVATLLKGTWRTGARAVWAASPRNVWVVADHGVHHYDGVAWSPVRVPGPRLATEISGAAGTVWVGGDRGAVYALPSQLPAAERGACAPVLPAYCNVPLRGHTDATGDGPIDCNGVAHPGGELHYAIAAPINGMLTATVTSRFPVDIAAVTADERGDCDVATCVERGPATEVTFPVEQGKTYFLTVGAAGEPAPFTLDIDCDKE
jgi:hypothetical protein